MTKYKYSNRSRARDVEVDQELLDERYARAERAGYSEKAKWIEFCEMLLREGYILFLYEAKETYSKYITITHPTSVKSYRVRFSNHPPSLFRELSKDCDFFVGRTNQTITTTGQALVAVRKYFGDK